jgi:hypothetical protein
MDPARHPNPRRFDPTRDASDHQTAAEAASNPDASKRDHFVFGAGRCVCQGMHVAERSLFLALARLLWGFEFLPKKDANGKEMIPDPNELTEGFVVMPKEFQVEIRPRSERHVRTMREEWERAQDVLDAKGQWMSVPEGMVRSTSTYKEKS